MLVTRQPYFTRLSTEILQMKSQETIKAGTSCFVGLNLLHWSDMENQCPVHNIYIFSS